MATILYPSRYLYGNSIAAVSLPVVGAGNIGIVAHSVTRTRKLGGVDNIIRSSSSSARLCVNSN